MKLSKIAVILPANVHWNPYYYRYESMLADFGVDFDVLIWNRGNIHEKLRARRVFAFALPDRANDKNPLKVFKFIRFAKFVRRVIRRNGYEKLVFVGNQAALVPLLAFFLARSRDRSYWYDYRDYEYEWFAPYAWLQRLGIRHSFATVVSSRGYLNHLPRHPYSFVHNIDPVLEGARASFRKEPGDQIRISFIGNVRYLNENKRLLRALGNDERFLLQYFGVGSEAIQDFCVAEHIRNALFHGRFPQSETLEFYRRTDIINNLYGNQGKGVSTALSNKLYYSAALHIPILVSPGTYMQTVTEQYGFGFADDVDDQSYADRLYDWYKKGAVHEDGYDKFWNQVSSEDAAFARRFREFVKGGRENE